MDMKWNVEEIAEAIIKQRPEEGCEAHHDMECGICCAWDEVEVDGNGFVAIADYRSQYQQFTRGSYGSHEFEKIEERVDEELELSGIYDENGNDAPCEVLDGVQKYLDEHFNKSQEWNQI